MPGRRPGHPGQQTPSERPLDRRVEPGDDEGLEPEEREANVTTDLEHAAELMEIWRLCRKSRCKRARSCCGDARACCERLVDWSVALSFKDKRVGFDEAMQRLREPPARE